ncbi:MAG: hypothetical protein KDA31_02965 [Phycisphaerales bacterium]|nr:hypothetical protein [Phycisphaerales bacterium]MCB9837602.1 PEP-CTERM sorting domain-containing protein [Phycisphaera sp.]
MRTRTLAVVSAAVAFAAPASADVIWDEAINGDLSSDNLNPTLLAFVPGSNMVFGSTSPEPELDPDYFTMVIPAGYELSSIIFEEYVSGDDQAFFAVEAAAQITDPFDPTALLSAVLIGSLPGTMQGDELLDDLQNPNVWGGFTGNLPAGTYTFWYQEITTTTDYGFDFVITPVPAPATATLAVGGLLLARRRR